MPRTPAGTAKTSAFDRIACILLASICSSEEISALFSNVQSLVDDAGAKFGMPLTVP